VLHDLYAWTMRQAAGPHAERALAVVAFLESSVFPVPPDAMLVPMVLARPHAAWRLALICTAGSVVGGLFGYLIGYALLETLGEWIIGLYGLARSSTRSRPPTTSGACGSSWSRGLTPIPYKLVTIASGMAHFNLGVFILASIVTRGARFMIVAALLRFYGQPIRAFIERRLTLVTSAFAALVVLGFVSLRYL
jgi:membrane protein YqaA with SNARE-associated domain